MRIQSALRTTIVALVATAPIFAQFQSGDVFREVVWKPSTKWARVTGNDATASGAAAFLPNPVHSVSLPDLTDAIRCEAMIEKLSSHSGTRLPRMRINSNAWISIPEIANSVIPGQRGRLGQSWEYLQMAYPAIPVPLTQLKVGTNTFEFACQGSGGSAHGKIWPQWLHYSVVFRIYYKTTKTGAPDGSITTPRTGDLIGTNPKFEVQATAASGTSIRRVEFLGDYDDFDWNGDGLDSGWQGNYRYGVLQHHIGSTTTAPWSVTWSNSWIPTQRQPFQVVARIVSSNGLIRISEPITIGMLRTHTVHRYVGSHIAPHWQTNRQLLHSNNNYVTGDLSKAKAAQFVVATWNARAVDELRLNGSKLLGPFGRSYDLSYDSIPIDVNRLRPGNIFETIATTHEHGIEVQWPGFEIFVQYDIPETTALFIPYGRACTGSKGLPLLSNQGTPKLSQGYTVTLANGKASSAAIILNGFSKDKWNGFDLPFDWTGIGATGCLLQTSIDFTLGVATDTNGSASQLYVVPNRTIFLGGSLFAQFAILDLSANPLGITFSNGGRWVFGK